MTLEFLRTNQVYILRFLLTSAVSTVLPLLALKILTFFYQKPPDPPPDKSFLCEYGVLISYPLFPHSPTLCHYVIPTGVSRQTRPQDREKQTFQQNLRGHYYTLKPSTLGFQYLDIHPPIAFPPFPCPSLNLPSPVVPFFPFARNSHILPLYLR